MARISTYAVSSPAELTDELIGSDVNKATKNFTVQSIVDLVGGTFTWTQTAPATEWGTGNPATITHSLNKFPSITVVDTAGTVVIGEYTYINSNTVSLHFSAPFAGKAYLN